MNTNPRESRFYEGMTTWVDSRGLRPTRQFKLENRCAIEWDSPESERAGLGGARQAAKTPGVSLLNKVRVVGSPSGTKGSLQKMRSTTSATTTFA